MYQPSGGAPVTAVWIATASAIAARSSARGASRMSTHLRPWQAISHAASRIAATASGLRASAVATPNTVMGTARRVNNRHRRQNPARAPYS